MSQRRIKKRAVVNEVVPSKKRYYLWGGIAAILLVCIILMVIDGVGNHKVTIINHTDKDIDTISLYFKSPDTGYESKVFLTESIKAGKTITGKMPKLQLNNTEARLMSDITFNGEKKIQRENGYFNINFNGKTIIEFDDNEDGSVKMTVKIDQGLMDHYSNELFCDEEWNISFE